MLNSALSAAIAATESDGNGEFGLDSDQPDAVRMLARFRGPVFAAAHRDLDPETRSRVTLDAEAQGPLWPVSLALTGGVPLPVSLLAIPDRIPSFPPGPAEEWTYRLDSTTNETFAVWPLTEAKSEFRFQEGWWRLLAMRAEGGRIRSLEHGRTSWQLSSARTLPDGKAIDVTAAGAHLLISRPVSIELKIDPIET